MLSKDVNKQQLALVVDDDITNRMVLSKFLEKLDYRVVESENGKEAIDHFIQHAPDIVFMDVMMPEMNGYEATTQIKYLCKDNFVPVIFLTALTDADDLTKCIDAGGDDYLSKPLEMTVLRAKIHAIERIRDLYRQVQTMNKNMESANQIANKVFEQAVFTKNKNIKSIDTWFRVSDTFNNDLFLVAQTPSNGINILFGHFNAEGLSSAVGALPTSEVFRTMSKKGFAPHNIVQKLNAKLYDLLPNGITLSMILININESMNQALICNYNMPNVYFINDKNNETLYIKSPVNNAIGETPRHSRDVELERVSIDEQTHIILGSSDIFNCTNENNKMYQSDDYIRAIQEGVDNGNILNTLKQSILHFSKDSEKQFNFSLVEIPCTKELITNNETIEKELQLDKQNTHSAPANNLFSKNTHQVEFSLNINGKSLRSMDPIPTLLNNLESITDIEKHQEVIFTILTELYVNALDHGVLGLDSKIKESADGFNTYYQTRENMLREINDGFVNISIVFYADNNENKLIITVQDSGDGFNIDLLKKPSSNIFSGRGVKLIKGLCESMTHNDKGNQVQAVYCWQT